MAGNYQKGGRPANTFNGRKKIERKAGGQKGHKGTTLTKSDMEDKIKSGKCRHEIMNIGDSSGKSYVTKYVMDLSVVPFITSGQTMRNAMSISYGISVKIQRKQEINGREKCQHYSVK